MAHDRTYPGSDNSHITMNAISATFNRLRALYRASSEPENLRPLADMYWRFMLGLMLVSIAGVVMFGTWEFVAVIDRLTSLQNSGNSTPPVALDRYKLEATLSAYSERQARFQAALSARIIVGDPSK